MMTVSKSYARLEAEGILERVRGTGMRVLESRSLGGVGDRQKELKPLADAMIIRGLQLNLSEAQILTVVRNLYKERHAWLKSSSTSQT